MIYTAEQYAQLALQASNALHHYEMEQHISNQLRREKAELASQNDELYQEIARLQAELNTIKSCL